MGASFKNETSPQNAPSVLVKDCLVAAGAERRHRFRLRQCHANGFSNYLR
jgi:hypothetical protein